MREISMERVEQIRQNIYDTITSVTMTHEQKLTSMCCHADSLMEVIDLPEGLDELLNVPIPQKCICDLNEGHAPMRPRYIVPDYAKFMSDYTDYSKEFAEWEDEDLNAAELEYYMDVLNRVNKKLLEVAE